MPWYACELGQVVSPASPCTPSGSGAHLRADSLFPDTASRGSSSKGVRSRMSKPLSAIPGLHPQLDPTLPPSAPNAASPITWHHHDTTSLPKSLNITVPRVPPRTLLLFDIADISTTSTHGPSCAVTQHRNWYQHQRWRGALAAMYTRNTSERLLLRPPRAHHRLRRQTITLTLLLPFRIRLG
jgi:hypothetical protein